MEKIKEITINDKNNSISFIQNAFTNIDYDGKNCKFLKYSVLTNCSKDFFKKTFSEINKNTEIKLDGRLRAFVFDFGKDRKYAEILEEFGFKELDVNNAWSNIWMKKDINENPNRYITIE